MGYIYKITNKINNKVYIGQTKNLIKYRWQHHLWKANHPEQLDTDYPLYRAMRKYGIQNFSIEEIEQTNDLNIKEKYWIKYYNSVTPNGYNCDLGGAGVSKFNHQEILNYFLTIGNQNVSKTAKYFNCSLVTVLKILEQNDLSGLGKYQPVYQINISTGEIIRQFNSLVEAREFYNIGRTQMWSAVHGQAKTAAGYAWCKIQDLDKFILTEHIDNKTIKIQCIETNQIFNSISSAVDWLKSNTKFINASAANICKAYKGERKTAYGFHWKIFD